MTAGVRAAALKGVPGPGRGAGPSPARPHRGPAPRTLPRSAAYSLKRLKWFFSPITGSLTGVGGIGICKAYPKPPAESRLTNVVLYFIITAAAATPADLA